MKSSHIIAVLKRVRSDSKRSLPALQHGAFAKMREEAKILLSTSEYVTAFIP